MLVLQAPEEFGLEFNNLKYSHYQFENKTSKLDIVMQVFPVGGDLQFDVLDCSKLYRRHTMEIFMQHFLNILDGIITNPGAVISDIDILTAEEKKRIGVDFNNPNLATYQSKTISAVFERQVEIHPKYRGNL